MEELRSRRSIGERSWLEEEDSVEAACADDPTEMDPVDRVWKAISSRSSQLDGRTIAIDGHCL
jgi:hypothetical protein